MSEPNTQKGVLLCLKEAWTMDTKMNKILQTYREKLVSKQRSWLPLQNHHYSTLKS